MVSVFLLSYPHLAGPIPPWGIFLLLQINSRSVSTCPDFIPSPASLASSQAWQGGDLLLSSCWCPSKPSVASPSGNTRRWSQTLLPRESQCFEGILSHAVGLCLHQDIVWTGSIHDGVMFHDTVHAHWKEQRKQWICYFSSDTITHHLTLLWLENQIYRARREIFYECSGGTNLS